ncbi:hypothetical protein F4694_000563 [Bacillus niacini]|uniref:Renal dipeptidase n=1 Tax=Neobacillus niacini TaxID=86668 RepID=A0A852T8S7_9BACI|nr:nucleotidyltransferase family protein [Neobacillus niacini]NYE03844.1 hypothetical protein [Neobacillus niacini]
MGNKYCLNIDQIPIELRLILKIIVITDDNNLVETVKEFKDINWEYFLELAMHHRIYPLLYRKLNGIDYNLIPSYVLNTLQEAFKRNTFKMLQLSGEIEHVNKVFEENQIRMLVLKGPVLSKDLYGDLSLRTCGDLDLLVSINDLEKVDNLLLMQGYIKEKNINKELNDWKWRKHHIGYIHPLKKIIIEIHWRLNPFPGTGPKFEDLWFRKRRSALSSNPLYYLGIEDLFLFLVSHGARHGWFRIRWLVDINQIVKQKIDWDFLLKLLKKYQYLPVGGQAVVLASALLDTPIKTESRILLKGNLSKKLAQAAIFYLENTVNIHTESIPKDVSDYHKRHLFSILTKRQKCLYILSFLYPYPIDVETLPLSKPFRILYFPLRPFLWAWRKTKKHSLIKM